MTIEGNYGGTMNSRSKSSFIEYLKYCVVGVSCAVIDLGALNGLLYLFPTDQPVKLSLYNSIAYGLAVLNSYTWNSKYTFKVKKTPIQFLAFIFQALISLMIANLVFLSGLWLLGVTVYFPKWLQTNISKILSMFLSSTASFFFNKLFVFRKKSLIGKND
jgi:putative flippase GtrA